MIRTQVAILTAALVCVFGMTNSYILPAGRCKTLPYEVKSIDYKSLASLVDWNIIYAPDEESFRNIDHYMNRMTYSGYLAASVEGTAVFTNGSTSSYTAQQKYLRNFIVEVADDRVFYIHPLAVLEDHSTLFYRCSIYTEGLNEPIFSIDTRYIAVPKGTTLTESSHRQLMKFEARFNFTGEFYFLPYLLYNEV